MAVRAASLPALARDKAIPTTSPEFVEKIGAPVLSSVKEASKSSCRTVPPGRLRIFPTLPRRMSGVMAVARLPSSTGFAVTISMGSSGRRRSESPSRTDGRSAMEIFNRARLASGANLSRWAITSPRPGTRAWMAAAPRTAS
jgi:hypothetical protein